ncbi:hypothetical protein V5F44_02600 [Xanthobacter sp. V2C-8]
MRLLVVVPPRRKFTLHLGEAPGTPDKDEASAQGEKGMYAEAEG